MSRSGYSIINSHPRKKEIIEDLINQVSYRHIQEKYNLSSLDVIKNFTKAHLKEIAKAKAEDREILVKKWQARLDKTNQMLDKMMKACDEWLRDPDYKSKYTLDYRADEIKVIYFDENSGRTKRASLQSLIQIGCDYKVDVPKTDNRILTLKCLELAMKDTELIAKLTGDLKELAVVADTSGVVIPKLISEIQDELEGEPEIQQRVIKRILEVVNDEG